MAISVTMDSMEKKSLTDVTQAGYYSASFSTGAGYYLLSYAGPDVPWQKVKKANDENFNSNVEDNAALRALLNATQVPTRRWSTVNLNGHGMWSLVMNRANWSSPQRLEADEGVFPGYVNHHYRMQLHGVFAARVLT